MHDVTFRSQSYSNTTSIRELLFTEKISIPGVHKLEVLKSDKHDCLNAIKIGKFKFIKIYVAGSEGPAHDLTLCFGLSPEFPRMSTKENCRRYN